MSEALVLHKLSSRLGILKETIMLNAKINHDRQL